MPDYWVWLGKKPDSLDDDHARKCCIELQKLASHTDGNTLSFRTHEFDEVKVIVKKAVTIYQKYYPDIDAEDAVVIQMQPQCGKCDELMPLGSAYCSICGVRLPFAEEIDVYGILGLG